ncbi:MAG: carboxypeptidase regulatory-like domain-containing protein [Myxococcota bacterium]
MAERSPTRHPGWWLALIAVLGAAVAFLALRDGGDAATDPEADRAGSSAEAAPEAPSWTLAGRVVARSSGDGVADATVRITCEERERSVAVRTDADGAFGIEEPIEGACEVRAEAEGWSVGGPGAPRGREVEVRPGEPPPEVTLRLSRTGSVSGRVVRDGRGVEGVPLSVLQLRGPDGGEPFSTETDARTDAEGRFTLDGLLPGRLQLLAEPSDGALAESDVLDLVPGGVVRGVALNLPTGGRLTGWVLGPDDVPVEGARVLVYAPGASRPRRDVTDAEGAFDVDGLPEGEARVAVMKAGYAPARRVPAEVIPGEANEVVVRLEPAPGFRGIVLGPDGRPAGAAAIHLVPVDAGDDAARRPPVTHTHPDGHFVVPTVSDFPVRCRATHGALGRSEAVVVSGPGEEITLRLRGGDAALTGRVVDESGRPVTSYHLDVLPSGPRARRGGRVSRDVRDGGGRFRLEGLDPGRYDLVLRAPGRAPVRSGGHQVERGRVTDVGDVVMPRQATIEGRILDADTGDPLVGVRVRAQGVESGRGAGANAETDRAGRFRLERVPIRRLSLSLRRSGYTMRMVSGLQPQAGQVLDIGTLDMLPSEDGQRMEYGGIGAMLGTHGDQIVLRRVFDGSAAGEAGLGPGARILEVDGRPASELGLRGALEMLRGEPDSEVSLTVVPHGGGSPREVRIQRRMVKR